MAPTLSDNGFGSYYAHMKVGEQTDDYLMFIDNGVSNNDQLHGPPCALMSCPRCFRARILGSTAPNSSQLEMRQIQAIGYP